MTYGLLFALIFIAGPLLFRALTGATRTIRMVHTQALFAVLCAVGGVGLHFTFGGQGAVGGVASLLCIWAGWIGVLAYGALALRRHDASRKMRRLTAVLGTAGTTVPWFGLASASMIAA